MLFSAYLSSFSAIIFLALVTNLAAARPSPHRRSTGIKLPLRRRADPEGVHPEILHEHRIHQGLRRYASMTGQEGPSDADLSARLEARRSLIEKRLNSSELGFIPPVTPAASNTVGLDIAGSFYEAEVSIGTPPRNYHVLVDTGSDFFWVQGENCTLTGSSQSCGPKSTLGPSSSSTFQQSLSAWAFHYGAGNVTGSFGTDTVNFAGLTIPATVAVAASIDESIATLSFDGIMGLAPGTTDGIPSFVTVLQTAGAIQNNVFGIRLARSTDPENNSELTIGSSDTAAYDASTLVTVNSQLSNVFWIVPVDTVFVNGVDTGLGGRTALLDTGNAGIQIPQADIDIIVSHTPGATLNPGGANFPCNTTFEISFGGRPFTIQTQDVLDNLFGTCQTTIQVASGTTWALGEPFLRNVYSIFDLGHNTVSFAELV